MTRIFYDCEFIEDGKTIELISMGFTCECDHELYLINQDVHIDRIYDHPWLSLHVLPHLPLAPMGIGRFWDEEQDDIWNVLKKRYIADRVKEFITAHSDPELWAWYGAYDHVALAQLWGPMVNLPNGIPMWTNDLKQECVRLGNPTLPEQPEGLHNALADARHLKLRFDWLMRYEALRNT